MRFLHVSDTHVGFTAYHRLTGEGLNQREADFFDAFARAIDLAIDERVDFVLHSGDLFDSVRPSNRAISHVLTHVRRLGEANIPFVVISGNHEAPRLRETGAVLRLLDFLPNTHSVYKGATEMIRIGDCAIHATPHAPSPAALVEQLRAVRPNPDARYNVATLHAGVVGIGDFSTGEFNEQTVAQNDLPADMDYIAMGHYHGAMEVAPKTWYAGSTERCSFKEDRETKSVNLVDLGAGTVKPVRLETRPMMTLKGVHLEGVAEIEMARQIYARIAENPLVDAIARLRVTGLPPHVYASLDFDRIKKLSKGALHFEFQPELLRDDAHGASHGTIGALADEFESFMADQPLDEADRETLVVRAKELLASATQDGGGE